MWLFSKVGFYSITNAPDRPGSVQVRGRVQEDMDKLVALAQEKLGLDLDYVATPGRDYAYRIYMSPDTWAQVAHLLTVEILDYSNYKNSIHGDRARDNAYYDIWHRMSRLQREKADPGKR